jgi:GR25 family glycosyltransferase involved in LPS biosynthesis
MDCTNTRNHLPMLPVQGYYINLDASIDRRVFMQNRLANLGLTGSIARFSALQGDDRPSKLGQPTLGCYLSHQAVIEAAPKDRITLVLEDDVDLPVDFAQRLDSLLVTALQIPWDILFLSQTPGHHDVQLIASWVALKRKLAAPSSAGYASVLLEGHEAYQWGATSYLVRPGGHDKIAAVLREGAEKGYPLPVDDLYRYAMAQKWFTGKCLFPFMTGLNLDHETTHSDRSNPELHKIGHTLVNLFAPHIDLEPLTNEARQAMSRAINADATPEALIVSHLVHQMITDMH